MPDMGDVDKIIKSLYGPALERQLENDPIGSLSDRVRDPRPIYTCLRKPMDVGEMIRVLSKLDPNMVVTVLDGEHYDLEIIRRMRVVSDDRHFNGDDYVLIES